MVFKNAPIINDKINERIIKSVKANTTSETPTQIALNNNKCGLYLKSPRDATNIVLIVEPKAFAADKYPNPWALSPKISLATIYNTVEAFKRAGHIREILTNNCKSYYDTNIKSHHHFYDPDSKKLTDIDYQEVIMKKIPNPPKGKKIKDLEVVISLQKK